MYVNSAFIASINDTDYAGRMMGAAAFSPPGATTQADVDFLDAYEGNYLNL